MRRWTTTLVVALSLTMAACGADGADEAGEPPASEVSGPAADDFSPGQPPGEGGFAAETEVTAAAAAEGSEESEVTSAAAESDGGAAESAAGDPFAASVELDAAVEGFVEVIGGTTGVLDEDQLGLLHDMAAAVLDALWGADLDGAGQAADALTNHVQTLLDEGVLTGEEAAAVFEALLYVDDVLGGLAAPLEIPTHFPPYTPECEALDASIPHAGVWVAEDAGPGGDGSSGAPFTSIEEALGEHGGSAVEIHLAVGTYTEDITISADTRIIADAGAVLAGSITNTEPLLLEVSYLTIQGTGAAPANIDVSHPCAATVLDGVSIVGSVGAAVRHSGGTAHLRDVRVVMPSAPDGVTPALVFDGGAQATLDNVSVGDAVSGALAVRDDGTVVRASRLRVFDTGTGAIEVSDDAMLEVVSGNVTGSRFFGVTASAGGYIRAAVLDVSGVVGSETEAHGLVARTGAVVDLRHFRLQDGSVCGVHLSSEATVDLSWGRVRRFATGACVLVADYDLDRLRNCVYYEQNGVNLQAVTMPVGGIGPFGTASSGGITCDWVYGT